MRTWRSRRRLRTPRPLEATVTRHGLWFTYPAGDTLGSRLATAGTRTEIDRLGQVVAETGRSGTLLDVGANIGTTTIPALALHGFERAVCVEPHPLNARILRANLALNGVEHLADVIEVAAAAREGLASLRESRGDSGAHALSPRKGTIAVRTITLDSLEVEPDLLWLDIQGAEGEALAGASATLAARPAVVFEYGSGVNTGLVESALAGYAFTDLGTGAPVESLADLARSLGKARTDVLALP